MTQINLEESIGKPPYNKMQLVILEGCHGVGKTSIAKKLREQGYRVLIEDFDKYLTQAKKEYPTGDIESQLYLAQLSYVAHMIFEILRAFKDECKVFIMDRFLLTTMIYSTTLSSYVSMDQSPKDEKTPVGDEISFKRFVPIIRHLSKFCNFSYYIIQPLTAGERNQLDVRIQERLLTQPWRKDLFEDEKCWTDLISLKYETSSQIILTLLHGENEISVQRLNMSDNNWKLILLDCMQYL